VTLPLRMKNTNPSGRTMKRIRWVLSIVVDMKYVDETWLAA
jgi:hypothetical protein